MRKFVYEITEDTKHDDGETAVKVYGLRVYDRTGEYRFDDLCTDRGRLEKFAHIAYRQQPCISALPDLFSDFLFTP